MQTIYLDISNKGVIPTVYAKQNDVGRKFAVILTDSGLPYIPVSGSAFSVWYKGASGEGNYTDIGEKSAFSLSGNKVEVEMIVQMLSAHGDGILCLTLNSPDGNQISSWNIPYMCEFVPGAESEKAEEYYTAFSKAVEELLYPDKTLSIEGKAADAAAVGEALAKKADISYTKKIGNPHNLLDNSDFRNPVNQRGKTSYAESGYTIDRWRNNAGLTVDVGTDGVTLTHNGSGKTPDFYQPIQYRSYLLGKKVTIAVGTNRGTFVVSGTIPTSVSGSANLAIGTVAFGQLQLQAVNSTYWLVNIYATSAVTVYWVALYEGEYTAENLPEYQPKGYGAELAECMRYYQHNTSGLFVAPSSNLYVALQFPMRIIPTITVANTNGIDCSLSGVKQNGFILTNNTGYTSQITWVASADL